MLNMLALYAGFVIEAGLLARRRARLGPVSA